MTRDKLANSYHERGFNCAQAVLASFCAETGLDERTALAVAGGFGGGLRHGDVCGAVSGAIMAIGLTHPYNTEGDAAAKGKIAELTREFHRRFLKSHPALTCRELLGVDISTPEVLAEAQSSGLMKGRCPGFIGDAALLCEQLLNEQKQ
ncbi:C-GCAxxG-C-C family protein [Feifania hominis]|uniref:C_GCAxxG_C_C family protein n=1 Tax=Feifania hominis TaxID=2763660 RepID=A0A926DF87_9FIRM|nr:C-GCAxxG-C-C family protein [Feifania hominis]MBC8535935.1 C_GCAxxG_C_C family protein [Feifania hominis]